MKFTKTHERQIREFMAMAKDDCVSVSKWVSGSGRFTTPKATPPFVKRYKNGDLTDNKEINSKIKSYFMQHPKRKAVLIIDSKALADFLFKSANGNIIENA